MKVRLEKSGKVLKVLFRHIELAQEQLEGGLFRRRYRSSRGVTFTIEERAKVFFLYVSFDLYKDVGVLSRISSGRPVAELLMLSKLSHLPCAKIYVTEVPLPDGRNVDLIDTVKFELRKVADDVWESGGIESEVDAFKRQMTLNSLKDGLPEFYLECGADTIVASQGKSARSETIFTKRVTEIKPETRFHVNFRKGKESKTEFAPEAKEHKEVAPERRFNPAKQSASLPIEAEPHVNGRIVSEDRDPSEIAECDGCKELCYKRELIEIKPGLYVCGSCANDDDTLRRLGLTPDEMESFWRLIRCDWCGQLLTEVEPGRWLCPGCFLEKEVAPPPPTEQGPEEVIIESRLKDGVVRLDVLKVDGMRWLETRVDIPVGPGKFVPAGKWIVGTRVTDGWKIGAEYSFAVECIWRMREKACIDKGNVVKVDVEPSIIVPDSTVTPGVRVFGRP
jgi:formylmethanofuran dehydrogenase subunit E